MSAGWPPYYAGRLKIGRLKSPVAIITLWDLPETAVARLDRKLYAAAGSLRSRRGISFLLRNILANPGIRYLLVCGRDLGNVKEDLRRLFVKKDGRGFGDEALPAAAVAEVVKNVELLELSEKPTASELKAVIARLRPKPPFAEPRVFPLPKVKTAAAFPADPSLFRLGEETVGEAWLGILKTILKFGLSSERIGNRQVRVLLNLAVTVEKENPRSPKWEPYFLFKKKELKSYIDSCFSAAPSRDETGYTYGKRLRNFWGVDQFEIMVKKLKSFPPHEGAVAVLWDVRKDNFPPKRVVVRRGGKTAGWNVPCLNLLQAVVLQKKLFLTAYFRANDMYRAWPFNAFALRSLQKDLAAAVGFKMGSLTTISHWAWIDRRTLPEVEEVVAGYYGKKMRLKLDRRGNFLVEVEGEEIVVTHLSPRGKILACYRENGKKPQAAERLYRKLALELTFSQIEHALDIGGQIARAEAAIKLGLKFEQDRPMLGPLRGAK